MERDIKMRLWQAIRENNNSAPYILSIHKTKEGAKKAIAEDENGTIKEEERFLIDLQYPGAIITPDWYVEEVKVEE